MIVRHSKTVRLHHPDRPIDVCFYGASMIILSFVARILIFTPA